MPKPRTKSVKMVALCQWFERNPATYMFEPVDDEIVRCPALVGQRKVTVWLPKADSEEGGGARIVKAEHYLIRGQAEQAN